MKKSKAFTLIEVLVVISIILAFVMVTSCDGATATAGRESAIVPPEGSNVPG